MNVVKKKHKIKVEVIGIYPEKHRADLWGTFHVFIMLDEFAFDLRGGEILKKGKDWLVYVPQAHGTDDETGKAIQFPVLSFPERDLEIDLRNLIICKVKEELKKMIDKKK